MAFDHEQSRVKSVEVVSVLKVKSLTGTGEEPHPLREITEYFTLTGRHLSQHQCDPELPQPLFEQLHMGLRDSSIEALIKQFKTSAATPPPA